MVILEEISLERNQIFEIVFKATSVDIFGCPTLGKHIKYKIYLLETFLLKRGRSRTLKKPPFSQSYALL